MLTKYDTETVLNEIRDVIDIFRIYYGGQFVDEKVVIDITSNLFYRIRHDENIVTDDFNEYYLFGCKVNIVDSGPDDGFQVSIKQGALYDFDEKAYHCPICYHTLNFPDDLFCSHCGTRISWGDQ